MQQAVAGSRWGCMCVLIAGALTTAACRGEARVFLELDGAAPGVAELRLQLVTGSGVVPGIYRLPENGGDVRLPGSVVIRLDADAGEIGIVVWAVDADEKVVATAHTKRCVSLSASDRANVSLLLTPSRDGWSQARTADCRCDDEREDMCAPAVAAPPDAGVTPAGVGGGSGAGGRAGGADAAAGGAAGNTVVRMDAAAATDVALPAGAGSKELFGFESAADWTTGETTVTTDASERKQGMASLAFTLPEAGAVANLISRAFAARDLGAPVPRIGLEVFIGAAQPDAPRQSNIRMFMTCPGVLQDQFVDYQRLSGYPPAAWVTIVFQVPDVVIAALTKRPDGCTLKLQHEGKGLFRYDDLRFLP